MIVAVDARRSGRLNYAGASSADSQFRFPDTHYLIPCFVQVTDWRATHKQAYIQVVWPVWPDELDSNSQINPCIFPC
jgi:hypothetical protein